MHLTASKAPSICVYNTLVFNGGYGILSDGGGYLGNGMAGNQGGSVYGATRSRGENLCNGSGC